MRHDNNNSGPLQHAAKVHSSEITKLKSDLAHKEPSQAGGGAPQDGRYASLEKYGESQNQQGLNTKQGAHSDSGNKIEDQSRHKFHRNRATMIDQVDSDPVVQWTAAPDTQPQATQLRLVEIRPFIHRCSAIPAPH